MPHRAHLFSLRIAHALREALQEMPYGMAGARRDLLAGVSVGLVAIPLAMALAIASRVPPQYGLYSAIVAGFIIPLCGGSRYSVSGPTAAFVVILYPIVQQYGLAEAIARLRAENPDHRSDSAGDIPVTFSPPRGETTA